MNADYPILEYDPARAAMIEPGRVIRQREVAEACVICFFKEVVDKAAAQPQARQVADLNWEDGPHLIHETDFGGRRLAFFHSPVGAAAAAGLLEEVIALGCRKFMVCGGCGVLEKEIAVGHLVVVTAAVRDEGVSYHYLPPGREVLAGERGVRALEAVLARRGLPYVAGKTWTTDAPYRETPDKVAQRREEGCLVVEMEAAGLLAVAQYRGAELGQVLYGGDDLSGSEWDHRDWQSQPAVREGLFQIAAEACLEL
jgi:uridine phosphorylase